MKKLFSAIKDLFDLGKPITTIKKKLVLVGIILISETVLFVSTGVIAGFKFPKTISLDRVFASCIKSPVLEGILFWGLIWILVRIITLDQKLTKRINILWPLIIVFGIWFGTAHLSVGYSGVSLLNLKIAGIVYGWLVAKTRSLWPNILIHALWNFCATLFFV